MSNRKDLVNIS